MIADMVNGFDCCRHFRRTPCPIAPCARMNGLAYNLDQLDEDRFRLTLPAAGFRLDDISVSIAGRYLQVEGKCPMLARQSTRLHQGLPDTLDCSFLVLDPLAIADTSLSDGLLQIDLELDPLAPIVGKNLMAPFDRINAAAVAA